MGEHGFESRQISFCQPNSFFCHAILIDISHIIPITRNCILFCWIESRNFIKFCLKFVMYLENFQNVKKMFCSKHHRMGRKMISNPKIVRGRRHFIYLLLLTLQYSSICGTVVQCSPAMLAAGVRFPVLEHIFFLCI